MNNYKMVLSRLRILTNITEQERIQLILKIGKTFQNSKYIYNFSSRELDILYFVLNEVLFIEVKNEWNKNR